MKRRNVQTLCAIVALAMGQGPAAAHSKSQSPIIAPVDWGGIWVAEKRFGPDLSGPVSLSRVDNGWVAVIQGDSVPVERRETSDGSVAWSFDFFGQGRFIGRQANTRSPIRGHWIQRPGVVQNAPYATPLRLDAFDRGAGYGGRIEPYVQEASLNIPLIAEPGDRARGATRYRTFLRDPERNLGMWFRIETVEVAGEELRFRNAAGELLATGRSVESGKRFSMVFPRFGETLDFTRRGRDAAPTFYPRRSTARVTSLNRPAEIADGWQTAEPGSTGLDTSLLTELVASIAATEPGALREPYIHGLLIAHRGKLVMEEYFHGFDRERPHDSRSAGKTIGATLLGIALHKGLVKSLDTPVYPLFGGVDRFANPDPRKGQLTLRHLVSMSPGLDCRDGSPDSPGDEDRMQSQDAQPDWYRYALDLPMVSAPGETSFYCTAGINLMGGAIQRATGMSLLRFFQETFADPLEISSYQMILSPTDDVYMGGGIRLRPRDFLKLGQVYLNGGTWKGTRLVSQDWVRQAAAAHATINQPGDYGYGWWRQTFKVRGKSIDTFFASGNGGQMLFVIPQLEMTVMMQAGNYSDGRTRNAFRDRFMGEFVIPAAMASQ
jgi:CubicO group peptidase (beta-lactamase class C family)